MEEANRRAGQRRAEIDEAVIERNKRRRRLLFISKSQLHIDALRDNFGEEREIRWRKFSVSIIER